MKSFLIVVLSFAWISDGPTLSVDLLLKEWLPINVVPLLISSVALNIVLVDQYQIDVRVRQGKRFNQNLHVIVGHLFHVLSVDIENDIIFT